jgi:hypothetical protein
MCSREFERQRRKQEAKANRKIAIRCNYHTTCNGVGDCAKCPHLMELEIVDLDVLEKEAPVAEEGCNCE